MNPNTPIKFIRLTQPVAIRGVVTPAVGQPFAAPAGEAMIVLGMGAAVELSEAEVEAYHAAKAKEVSSPETIQAADPQVETREPAPNPAPPPEQSAPRKRAR